MIVFTLSRINDTCMGYKRIKKFEDCVRFDISKNVLVFATNGEFVESREKFGSDYE